MDRFEQARDAVTAAFADVARPTDADLLHPQCGDSTDLEPLLPYDDWRAVPDAVVEGAYAALSFLSAAGTRFFLPAYLDYVLRHPDGGAAAVMSTVWSLQPSLYSPELAEFTRSKLVLLDAAQRAAVVGALEALVGHQEVEGALADWGT